MRRDLVGADDVAPDAQPPPRGRGVVESAPQVAAAAAVQQPVGATIAIARA
ncbi:hypothetical protein [Nocardiopsis chromatogenes]|uniref:hypothetical protein n=1 Tax=Nocardiopsis chromatogenes TaxID=280239 RepID=UPI0003605840|nr:hypothetical protein [Nocardiopsis chromatogenes]